MRHSGGIELTRASGFGPLPQMFEARVGEQALFKVFESAKLPIGLLSAPHTPIPVQAMMALHERCARHLGDRTFGLTVGAAMMPAGYGLWGQFGISASTLGEALRRLEATFWAHQTGAYLELVRDEDHWVWRYRTGRQFTSGHMQHSDHVILPMIAVCQLYLGRTWWPEWVEVNYARDPDARLFEEQIELPVRYGRRGTGFVLRPADLSRRRLDTDVPFPRPVALREVVADAVLANAPEPARSLSALVALRLLDGHTDLEGAAQLAGLSVQGLQRRLRQKGFSYREIVDRAREARARAILKDTSMTVVDVALMLGYEEHANFTRAFRRWTGHSPTEFRRLCSGAQST